MSSTWTDERVATLRRLWGSGVTARQIAAELGGVTRNAVIGAAHRLGLGTSRVVAPAYDAAARLWFLETGEEATTLRELSVLVPRAEIAGYHPGGFAVTSADRGYVVGDMRRVGVVTRPKFASDKQRASALAPTVRPVEPRKRLGRPRETWTPEMRAEHAAKMRVAMAHRTKWDRDAVLDMWVGGASGPEIEARLGMPKNTAGPIVLNARQGGDARAVRRGDPSREMKKCA